MTANEIIVHEVDRDQVVVVRGFSREGDCEARHAPGAHANIEVLALCNACGNALGSGLPSTLCVAQPMHLALR